MAVEPERLALGVALGVSGEDALVLGEVEEEGVGAGREPETVELRVPPIAVDGDGEFDTLGQFDAVAFQDAVGSREGLASSLREPETERVGFCAVALGQRVTLADGEMLPVREEDGDTLGELSELRVCACEGEDVPLRETLEDTLGEEVELPETLSDGEAVLEEEALKDTVTVALMLGEGVMRAECEVLLLMLGEGV